MMHEENIKLKENEKFYILALESLNNSPDSVLWNDSDQGRLLYVNDQACKKLGYTREELLTMTIADIDTGYPQEQSSIESDLIKPIKSGMTTHIQTKHRHRNGHLIPVEISFSFIKFEEHLYVSSLVRDITDRTIAEKQLQETICRLSVLYEIYSVTTRELDTDNLIKKTCTLLQKTLNFDALTFYLLDEEKEEIVLNYSIGLPGKILKLINILTEDIGSIGKAMFSKETTYLNYQEQSNNKLIDLLLIEGFTDAIAFPIMIDNKFVGGISLINKSNRPIDVKDQELLKAVCCQLSTVLHNSKLFTSLKKELAERKKTEAMLKKANEELERIASTDQLTNIWNRRHFMNIIRVEIERAKRYNLTMSLLLLDIDHFKYVNDKFGHQVGDIVLVEFARILRTNIRDFDLLARWGGEEFLILASQLCAKDAAQLAERLRKCISENNFQVAGSITVSIGVVEFNQNENLDLWIKKADDALYRAKELGRNRVEVID